MLIIQRKAPNVNLLTHPVIEQIPHCDGHYPEEFNLCKRDGLGYLRRVVLENELRCVNEYLSKTGKNFPGKHLLTSNTDPKNTSVHHLKFGPKTICDHMCWIGRMYSLRISMKIVSLVDYLMLEKMKD